MYHLFAGQGYYPSSGLGDYKGPYVVLEEAVDEAKRLTKKAEGFSYGIEDWYSILTENDEGHLVEVSFGYSW